VCSLLMFCPAAMNRTATFTFSSPRSRNLLNLCQSLASAVRHSAANVHDSKMLEDARRGGGVRCRADTRATGSPREASQASCEAARRQGLGLSTVQEGLEEEGHNPAHRPARNRVQREAGSAPVGDGENFVVAEPLSAVEGALRAASRRPPGVARSRLRLDLLEPRPTVLLGVLNVRNGFTELTAVIRAVRAKQKTLMKYHM
jgi:hypothetical protein